MDRGKIIKFLKLDIIAGWIKAHPRILWGTLIALLLFFISFLAYFDENPLLGYKFLAESLIASVVFLLVYFFGPNVIAATGKWIEATMERFFRRILYDFWVAQSQRLIEAIRRENGDELQAKDFTTEVKGVVLDTSAVIDGRILGVIKAGFLDAVFIVPQNVIDELQHLADKKAEVKRQKGRRGLDILKEIRAVTGRKRFKVVPLKSKPEEVDKSLVKFCLRNKTKIATVDYNLNKAAQVSGIEVLNVNKLANEVKPEFIPGEVLLIKLIQEGKEDGQAVGYLSDGTMIIVKGARNFIGEHKDVVVEKVLQTSAGKMVFAELS